MTSEQQPSDDNAPARAPGGHRRETERLRRMRFRRVLSIAGVLLLLVTLVIPATGYYVVFVRPLQEPALIINDSRYSWGDYMTRTRMLIAEAQAVGTWQPETLNSVIFDMLEELERGEIIRQYAVLEGIIATPGEVDREVRQRVLGSHDVDNPEITDTEFRERYRLRLEILKVTDDQFRAIARGRVLERKLDVVLRETVPAKVLQRHLFEIKFTSTETGLESARAALDRYDAGEAFTDLARELSDDSQIEEHGGDLGWIPEGIKETYDLVLYDLGDGAVSGPIHSSTGVSIIKAEGIVELRDVQERHRSTLETQALKTWVLARRSELLDADALSRPGGGISSTRYQWILEQLRQDRELFPRRTESG